MVPEQAEFNPYRDLSPQEYLGLVEYVNRQWLNHYPQLFTTSTYLVNHQSDLAIMATGSDGKLERHPQSQTELIVVTKTASLLENTSAATLRTMETHVHLDQPTEFRSLDEPNPLYYAFRRENLVYPDRILNSTFLYGSPEIHNQARRRILEEITSPQNRQRARRKMLKQERDYRRAMRSGRYANRPVFDPIAAIQYYDENPPQMGFKSAHLRAVQRKLDLVTHAALLADQMDIETALSCPPFTPARIRFLSDLDLISNGSKAESLITAYAWFLQQYHRAQEKYKNTYRSVAMAFDQTRFEIHHKVVRAFVE